MSLSDTLITNGDPSSVIIKDILRPANTQNLGGVFTSGSYRAVNITDQISTPGLQMFYVEVLNATSSGVGASGQFPIPGNLGFIVAYIVLRDISPSGKLNITLIPATGIYNKFNIVCSSAVNNVNASFLVIGV
jgi:hypothetical protein